jgi:hypothetical protein
MLRVPVAKLKAAAVESGYANLEIFSSLSGMWFFSYQTSSLPAHPSALAAVNLSPDIGVHCGKDSLGRPYNFSGFFKIKQRNPAWAVVGQGYVNPVRKTKGDSMQFNYNKVGAHTQTSGLGLGISGYGIDAGYKASGTSTSTANAEEDYPKQTKNTWFRTQFNVAQYRGMCHGGPGDTTVPQEKQHSYCPRVWEPIHSLKYYTHKCFWMTRSGGWFGGADWTHPRHIPSTPGVFCAPQRKGTAFKTANEKAVQWSSGFDIGASDKIKDVTLKASFSSSSQTGYDTNAQMRFQFARTGYICGTNKDPSNAAILVMRSNKS